MFTLSGVQPQHIVLPLSQFHSVWSSLRTATQNVVKGRHHHTTASVAIKNKREDLTASEVSEVVKTTLNDLGLEELSKNVKIEELNTYANLACSVEKENAKWIESFASADSFFENKNGFPQKQLLESSYGMSPASNFKISFNNLTPHTLRNTWLLNPMVQQTRGFKTRRSKGAAGLGTKKGVGEEQFSAIKYMRESVLGPKKGTESNKLKSLMAENESSPEVQEKMKIAFAEGYAASDRKEIDGGVSAWSKRVLRFMLYGMIIWLSLQLIQGYSALGGNMKINVLKGERYEVNPEEITVTFNDVKGVDEAKSELKDVVEFLKDPEKFKALGAKLPKGVLLVGPPGIGKTLLARAVAGEAGVPFFHASGSEFDEIFVGTGAKRVRQLFDAAKIRAPCVIFIDEIDTVGAKRTSSQIHPYANQTINQLLSEMDGFQQNEGVIVLGATNRRDNLDKALLRPGRFDVEVRVFPPDLKGRKDILTLYLKRIKVGNDIDIERIAKGTTGCTGADLENMVNQAALKAAMDGSREVNMVHMDFARDKVLMGPAKKTKIPDDETNWMTAYHEAGHTLVAHYTKDATPLNKVTIIPRGTSLGHTSFIPDKEKYNQSKSELLAQMDVAMGGRVAEEVIYGPDKVTTGAGSDFSTATNIATAMVKRFGMSEKCGVRVYDEEAIDSGLSMLKVNEVSPATTELVDSEIKRLLSESYERAKAILKAHSNEHRALAHALMKYETLDSEDISSILEGKKPKRSIPLPPVSQTPTLPVVDPLFAKQ